MLNILVQEKANPSQYSPTILGSMALCQGAKQPPWYILQNYLQILFWDLQFACLNTLDWLSVEKNTFSGASPFHIWTWGVPRSPEWDEKGRVCSHVQLPGQEKFHFLNLITCIWNINYRKYTKFISFIIWCLLSLCETRKTEVNWIFVWISKEIIFYFHSRAYHHKRWVFPLSTSNISIMMKIPSANT